MLLTGKLLSTSQDPARKTLIAICPQILKSRARYSPLCTSVEVCACFRRRLPSCSVLTMQLQTAYWVPQPWGKCVQGREVRGGIMTTTKSRWRWEEGVGWFNQCWVLWGHWIEASVLSLREGPISLEEVERSHEAGFQCFRKFCAWVTNGTAASQGQGSCVFPQGLESQILWFDSLRLHLTSWQCFLLPLLKHASSHTHKHTHTNTHTHSFSKLKWKNN